MIRQFSSTTKKEKEHTDAACLTCGRGLEEEVRDHAKVRGLLAHGGDGHGASESRERGRDCRGGTERKQKHRKTGGINLSKERKTKGALGKQQHTTAALVCFSLPCTVAAALRHTLYLLNIWPAGGGPPCEADQRAVFPGLQLTSGLEPSEREGEGERDRQRRREEKTDRRKEKAIAGYKLTRSHFRQITLFNPPSIFSAPISLHLDCVSAPFSLSLSLYLSPLTVTAFHPLPPSTPLLFFCLSSWGFTL